MSCLILMSYDTAEIQYSIMMMMPLDYGLKQGVSVASITECHYCYILFTDILKV